MKSANILLTKNTIFWLRISGVAMGLLIVLALSNLPGASAQQATPAGKIAFGSNRGSNHEIYVMNSDGSNQINITNNAATDLTPSWAPGSCVTPPSGLVAWYPGDGNPNDIQGGNHATPSPGLTYTTTADGKVAEAFVVNGTNGHLTTPTLNAGNAYTVTFWAYTTSTVGSYQDMIGFDWKSSTNFGDLYAGATRVEYWQNNQMMVLAPTGSLPVNAWRYVTLTYDGSVNRLYINGDLKGTSAAHVETFNNPVKIGLAFANSSAGYEGRIDEMQIFNRALSQTEIQAIAAADSAGECKSFEADVASRPNGDGSILSDDVVQIRKFLNTTDTPDQTTDEFQRADSAPLAAKGDGKILSDDVVQARRYQNGTNPKQLVGGPTAPTGGKQPIADDTEFRLESEAAAPEGDSRELRIENASGSPNQPVTVNIRVDAVGDESEYGFILSYDQTKLSMPVIGAGNAGASVRSCNTAIAGAINCSVGGFPNNNPSSSDAGIGEIAAGNNQILITVQFTVAANAEAGATPLALSNENASSDAPQLFTPTATNGMVTVLAPTAANVAVGGRVMNFYGRGVSRAQVTMTGQNGEIRYALTNAFGYYRFDEVEAGQTYILAVRHKKYEFAQPTRVLFVGEDLNEVDFTASP